jgi:hypothetical protein
MEGSHLDKFLSAVASISIAGLFWIVRTVFTNNKKILLLEERLKHIDRKVDEGLQIAERQNREFINIQKEILKILQHIDENKNI